ncbi:MAG: DUF333 domain-containing protein [Candidatus Pacearchaeota archaeon]
MKKILLFTNLILVLVLVLVMLKFLSPNKEKKANQLISNPASVYCIQNNGTLEIRENEKGQYGVCIFPDGSECEEWAYYKGNCKPGTK